MALTISHDVFLSYRSRDHARVRALADALAKHAGLRVFLDRWYLVAGEPWLGALERALTSCRAAAICIGPGELGPWQQREMCLALDRQAHDPSFRVIPVLLPGADPVLGFLSTNMWIDLRDGAGEEDFVALLAAALRGTMPPEVLATFPRAKTSVCPYRGLLYFREEDAPFFLGRESIIDELERTLARAALVSVVGASGSGKSSVVRAGLVPRLRRSRAPVWEVVTMVPGDRPLRGLAAAFTPLLEPEMTEVDLLVETNKLAAAMSNEEVSVRDVAEWVLRRQSGTERVLLVVDQWEELYTLTRDTTERAHFISQLLDASSQGALSLVLTLRGDFVGQALTDRRLSDRLQGVQVNVGPMTEDELRRAIEEPAQAVGQTFEPGLVEAILRDVGDEPGRLPLLEFVLRQLWERRKADRLLHEAYREIGSLEGAIASRAEHVFSSLPEEDRLALRHLFLRLARPGDGRDYTRLRVASSDIAEGEWLLVNRLADERLLVTAQGMAADDRTVEVSHEALLWHWDRLRMWLERDREFLLWRERLRPMVNAWLQRKEGDDALLQGAFLVEAEKWRIEQNIDLSPSEQRYIQSSVTAQTQQKRRRRYLAVSALTVLAVFLTIVGTLAGLTCDQARQRNDVFAHSVQEAREALTLAETLVQGEYISEALFSLDRCIVAARVPSDGELEGRCHLAAGRALAHVGYFDEASMELNLAAQLLTTDRDMAQLFLERGHTLIKKARIGWLPKPTKLALANFEHALDLATRAHANDLILSIEFDLTSSHAEVGDIVEAEHHLAIVIALDGAGRYESKRAQLAAQIAYRRGDLKRAQSQNAALYTKMPPGDERFEVCVLQARTALILGDLATAELWSRRGIDEVDEIQALEAATELRLRMVASRRAPYELLFVALARQNRFEDAIRAFDQWHGYTLLDSLAQPNSHTRPGLAAMAKNIRSLGRALPTVSSVLLMSTSDRRVVEALHSIDLLAFTVAEGEIWRITAHTGRLRVQRIGALDGLQDHIDRFRSTPTDPAVADALGKRLIPTEMFHDESTLHVILDEPLTSLPIAALRGDGKPLIAVRPVLHLLRLPSKDSTCTQPDTTGRATVLADGNGDLPYARREAERIARLLKTTAQVGDSVTSAALFAAKSDSVLHVATHAEFDSLQLHDRVVSALEISMEHLAPSLVVLAGCSSARSYEPEIGSMVTAFLASGSSHVIATNRPVSDGGAAEVTQRFYEQGGVADPIRTVAAIQAQLAETANTDWPSFVVFGSNPCVR